MLLKLLYIFQRCWESSSWQECSSKNNFSVSRFEQFSTCIECELSVLNWIFWHHQSISMNSRKHKLLIRLPYRVFRQQTQIPIYCTQSYASTSSSQTPVSAGHGVTQAYRNGCTNWKWYSFSWLQEVWLKMLVCLGDYVEKHIVLFYLQRSASMIA